MAGTPSLFTKLIPWRELCECPDRMPFLKSHCVPGSKLWGSVDSSHEWLLLFTLTVSDVLRMAVSRSFAICLGKSVYFFWFFEISLSSCQQSSINTFYLIRRFIRQTLNAFQTWTGTMLSMWGTLERERERELSLKNKPVGLHWTKRLRHS